MMEGLPIGTMTTNHLVEVREGAGVLDNEVRTFVPRDPLAALSCSFCWSEISCTS